MKYTMPDPIPDAPENVVKAILASPPPKEWEYMKNYGKRGRG